MTDYKKMAELLFPDVKHTPDYYENLYKNRNLKDGAEVTRFAPSPTGYLHLGNFFQAVVDRFIATKTGGKFYFRLEDTDKKREVEGADKVALTILKEYGIVPDEGLTLEGEVGEYGPYRQSDRTDIYKSFAKMLVEKGRAYPCFCEAPEGKTEILENREKMLEETSTLIEHDKCRDLSLEEVEANLNSGKKFAIRLKSANVEGDKVVVRDKIKGDREIPANLKDVVLIKANGIPPYPFAHPVDDHLMKTTTVVRGEDWYSSVATHIEIFEALGFEPINYLHTALICKIDEKTGNKRKLSKRYDPEADMRFFGINGYPKDAVIEYILTLANSNFEDWRMENPTASLFDFPYSADKMNAGNPMFDMVKLNNISKNYISRLTAEEVYDMAKTWAEANNQELFNVLENNKEFAINVFSIDRGGVKPRKDIAKWNELLNYFDYMFKSYDLINPNFEKFTKISNEEICNIFNNYAQNFDANLEKNEWFSGLKVDAEKFGFAVDNKLYKANPENYKGNVADYCAIIRLALTGKDNTPDLYSICNVLGKDELVARAKQLENKLK